ncbi:MaoC/PaaZ C-terminal domain-containing protein [Gordonia sp. VNQ95]|jgi:acyl dehydratase|uniref:MaoC/PaaZ C-terminal domain-containing protein n=1 Tax=Gordonia TaxID=2053 RepID=UPI0032B3B5F2
MTDPSPNPTLVYADDLSVGTRYEFDPHHVTEAAIVEYASAWDPQSFHIDRAAADAGAFRGLIASGIHTLAVAQRLSVDAALHTWEVIAGRRLTEVEFLAPVRPDDDLGGFLEIEGVDFDDRGRALVTHRCDLINQASVTVLRIRVQAYVRARPTTR